MKRPIFKSLPLTTPSLFPEDLFQLIGSDSPAKLVETVVNELDISELESQYKGGGASAFHPRMMLKVLFYGYFSNIYSCRKLEKALYESLPMMYLSGLSRPDYRTINHFRGERLKGLIHGYFTKVVIMLVELGYLSLEEQFTDGTKIEARSGRYTFVWRKNVERHKGNLEAKITQILSDIESEIQSDNQAVENNLLPRAINSAELKEKIAELKEKQGNLETKEGKKKKKAIEKLEKEHLPRLEGYESDLKTLGERNSFSKTDTDASFMRLKDDHLGNGQLKPAYNVQISTEEQFITEATLHQCAGDTTTLKAHLDQFEQDYGKQSKVLVADAGYGSEQNYEMMLAKNITAYVKYPGFYAETKKKNKKNPFLVQNLFYNDEKDFFVCPMGQRMTKKGVVKDKSKAGYVSIITEYQAQNCSRCPLHAMCHKSNENRIISINYRLNELKKQTRERLESEKGREYRKKRSIEPEAVFAQLKSNNGFDRFSFFGKEKAESELCLMAIGHNLRKLHRKNTQNPQKSQKAA